MNNTNNCDNYFLNSYNHKLSNNSNDIEEIKAKTFYFITRHIFLSFKINTNNL